jgi:hypothetical protein
MIIDYNNISLSSFLISQDNLLFEAMVLIKPRRGVMIIDGLFNAIEPRRGDIDVNCAIHRQRQIGIRHRSCKVAKPGLQNLHQNGILILQ